jgi:hypothetical protein
MSNEITIYGWSTRPAFPRKRLAQLRGGVSAETPGRTVSLAARA